MKKTLFWASPYIKMSGSKVIPIIKQRGYSLNGCLSNSQNTSLSLASLRIVAESLDLEANLNAMQLKEIIAEHKITDLVFVVQPIELVRMSKVMKSAFNSLGKMVSVDYVLADF